MKMEKLTFETRSDLIHDLAQLNKATRQLNQAREQVDFWNMEVVKALDKLPDLKEGDNGVVKWLS